MVLEFFKSLGRSRVESVKIAAKGKAFSAQAKAKSKASSKFNSAVDNAAAGAKNKAMGKGKKKQKKGGKEMGLFGRKKQQSQEAVEHEAIEVPEFGDKTQIFRAAIQESPKECVGWIVALNGGLKGQDFRLVPGRNRVGTAADCDIVLTDQYMSASHAVIRYEEGIFMLIDLDSTNGCAVNGTPCTKEELIDNDRIRMGRTELKFKSLY